MKPSLPDLNMPVAGRREFLRRSTSLAVAAPWLGVATAVAADSKPPERKIKLGLIGCGNRATWLGKLFLQHGGYEIVAVADLHADRAEAAAKTFNVPVSRRFSGLHGYRRLLGSGVEAVNVVNIPRFHAEQAHAAIEAGCHVYAAKPVAVDVPRALKVQAAGVLATQKKLCYLVDYQMPTDPINIEVVKRVHEGGLGRLMYVESVGISPPWGDPPVRCHIDEYLRSGCWCPLESLSGDVIVENNIHVIDAVLWLTGKRPTSAIGRARIGREKPQHKFRQVYLVTYEFDDGVLWGHQCQSLKNQLDWDLRLTALGDQATAVVGYRDKAYLKGGPKHFGGGKIESLYDRGVVRNIATFHQNIVEGRFDNPTVQRAVDGALTAVLGREAAARRSELTMKELLQENKELELDLSEIPL